MNDNNNNNSNKMCLFIDVLLLMFNENIESQPLIPNQTLIQSNLFISECKNFIQFYELHQKDIINGTDITHDTFIQILNHVKNIMCNTKITDPIPFYTISIKQRNKEWNLWRYQQQNQNNTSLQSVCNYNRNNNNHNNCIDNNDNINNAYLSAQCNIKVFHDVKIPERRINTSNLFQSRGFQSNNNMNQMNVNQMNNDRLNQSWDHNQHYT